MGGLPGIFPGQNDGKDGRAARRSALLARRLHSWLPVLPLPLSGTTPCLVLLRSCLDPLSSPPSAAITSLSCALLASRSILKPPLAIIAHLEFSPGAQRPSSLLSGCLLPPTPPTPPPTFLDFIVAFSFRLRPFGVHFCSPSGVETALEFPV